MNAEATPDGERLALHSAMADEKLVRLHNLKAILRSRGLEDRSRARHLSERLGKNISYWSGLLAGDRAFGEKAARNIEEGLGLPRGALDGADLLGKSAQDGIDGLTEVTPELRGAVGHALSQPLHILSPTIIAWELLLSVNLPERFVCVIQDEAMSPELQPGYHVYFRRATEPEAGKVMLLADSDEHTYIRRCRIKKPGHWEAVADSPAFSPLDSIQDGLRVLGVFRGYYLPDD